MKKPITNNSKSLKTVLSKKLLSSNLKRLTISFTVLGMVFSLVGGYLGYSRLYMTSERKFWSAIENSLSTPSVTRILKNGGTGNAVVQTQRFFYSPQMVTETKITYDQINSTSKTSVVTEGISFPDAQYSRYVSFNTDQTRPDGTLPNLDRVFNKWEENKFSEEVLEDARLNYINELVSLVIFGNYDANFRSEIMTALKNNEVYSINSDGITEEVVDGRTMTVYPVSVGLKAYAEQIQRTFVKAGYGEFSPLDPEKYESDSRVRASISIDKRNNSIVGVDFGSRQESYIGYGTLKSVKKPQADFSSGELEAIVQEEIKDAL